MAFHPLASWLRFLWVSFFSSLLTFCLLDSFKESVRAGKTPGVEHVYEEALIRQASQPRRKKGGDNALYSRAISEIMYNDVSPNAISAHSYNTPQVGGQCFVIQCELFVNIFYTHCLIFYHDDAAYDDSPNILVICAMLSW